MNLQDIAKFLANYSNRDKVMRTLGYGSLCLSGFPTNKNLTSKLEIISDQLNSCRTVLRLFDDIPMLSYTLSFGFGRHECDRILRLVGVLSNLIDQLYYPLEHIAWAADNKLLPIKSSDKWWTASCICWCLSLYLGLIGAIRRAYVIRQQTGPSGSTRSTSRSNLLEAQRGALLLAAQAALDLGHAVHWLPSGVLWAGSMKPWQRGLLGTLSSLISLHLAIKEASRRA